MKFRSPRLGSAQSFVALSVSLAVVLSGQTFAFASLAKSAASSPATATAPNQKQSDTSQDELRITSATATATAAGVMLQWRTNSAKDNFGFNIYRLKAGQRTRVNKEIIPGAVFAPNFPGLMRGGYSYSWFDLGGTADATYFIESVSQLGVAKTYEPLSPVVSKPASGFEQTPEVLSGGATGSTDSFEKYYPAAQAGINSPQGAIEDQWAIAAQTALKIAIKKDGWYRVTQPQMVAAGFNPTVDIRNLRLFVEAQEVAISTSQHSGPFASGDYIEFYGRGLDKATTDSRIYYLLAGTIPGKRVRGEIQLDGDPILPPAPTPTPALPPAPTPSISPVVPATPARSPAPQVSPATTRTPVLQDPIFFSWPQQNLNQLAESLQPRAGQEQSAGAVGRTRQERDTPTADVVRDYSVVETVAPEASVPVPSAGSDTPRSSDNSNSIATTPASDKKAATLPVAVKPNAPATPARAPRQAAGAGRLSGARKFRQRSVSKKRKKSKLRQSKQERNHAVLSTAAASAASAPPNFTFTAERKDRQGNYFTKVLNGDAENFFGQAISFNPSAPPPSQTINTPNPDLAAGGMAQLEVALQGIGETPHNISIEFNGAVVGSFSFFGFTFPDGHPLQVFNIPVSQLINGANTIRFLIATGPDSSFIDYVKITYPHLYRADADALRFDLRGTQSRQVDGFTTPSVRLIDYTDPLNVGITRPAVEPSGAGFAITVPTSDPPSKPSRLFYAIPDGQFDSPAALSLNEPSTLNQVSNHADFLIISHKSFVPSFTKNVMPANTSFKTQRESQGRVVSIVDVEDIYDEFSFGEHGPKAIKDFLLYASTHWGTPHLRYVIFAGDATLDPRDYRHLGNFDFVPTKLVDATFNETASDDWLADFDNDQIADIPVGRIPVRTVAEADTVIGKIVNFVPSNVPQEALLVADDPTGYFFNFETANDHVETLLPAGMTVQRVNVRVDGPALARTNVIAGFNEGRALVNYAGHGNVNVWSGSSIFFSTEAAALTNGNKLSFVVVMDCLNGYFQDPTLLSMSEGLLEAPGGGAVAAFASSGLTFPDGQHEMSEQLYLLIYGVQPIALGDAIKMAKADTQDFDVRKTWIFFGDPSIKIR